MKSLFCRVEINPCSRKVCQKDLDLYTKGMRGKFMVKIMTKVCTAKINKESELRQQIKLLQFQLFLKKSSSAWAEEA